MFCLFASFCIGGIYRSTYMQMFFFPLGHFCYTKSDYVEENPETETEISSVQVQNSKTQGIVAAFRTLYATMMKYHPMR